MSGPWQLLRARLARKDFTAGRLLLALDFDGTLSELVDSPDRAELAPGTRRLLAALTRRPDTKVSIISGRALDDVKRLVGLPGVYYAGNHGLEIEGPGLRWTHPGAESLGADERRELSLRLEGFPGLTIEHKRLGFAVHYRGVETSRHERLRSRVRGLALRLRERFRLLHGKKVYDFRLDVPWDKGHALRRIRRGLPGAWTSVFIGDDATDEEAFATLGPRALTVRVGRPRFSAARYVLPNRRLVDQLLESLSRR